MIALDAADFSDFDSASRKEWLLTNGIGGFASSTISGANTRRYHGLLFSALRPPVERVLMVSKIEEEACYVSKIWRLATNEFADGTISPVGYGNIMSFFLDHGVPTWRFAVADAVLEKRIIMEYGHNTTFVHYSLLRASAPFRLTLRPFCTYRDYHWHNNGSQNYRVAHTENSFTLTAFENARPYSVSLEGSGRFVPAPEWYWNFKHRAESARGLDEKEDLFLPGYFETVLSSGASLSIRCSAEARLSFFAAVASAHRRSTEKLLAQTKENTPDWISSLLLAADQFVVKRQISISSSTVSSAVVSSSSGSSSATASASAASSSFGASLIAGYHWFADWSRDTMISLSGITLVTGRPELARDILRTYSRYISEGMLPNRFIDSGEQAEYNSVDGALLYFYAVYQYWRNTKDEDSIAELFPVLEDIVCWYRRGTRFGIHVDSGDELLYAGEHGVQLTWMDAKVGAWVVTPRTGKPVEINALWHAALSIMEEFSRVLGHGLLSQEFNTQAARVRESFRSSFWYAPGNYLYDVIDCPEGADNRTENRDASLRPNQLIASGLPFGLLSDKESKAVVDICAQRLFTPYGFRTLDAQSKAYCGRYAGGQVERDGAYHQGTVWPWLLGYFVASHLQVYGDRTLARSFLDGLPGHMRDAGLGTLSEIFDGDPPFKPQGCIAQAWSVAEVLRAWALCEDTSGRFV